MASRPVFVPLARPHGLVDEIEIEFAWNPGFAACQKRKNVAALHEGARARGLFPVLEVSTKSEDPLGQRLRAFSLKVPTDHGALSLEAVFQGSKVFEDGGPYTDLYAVEGRAAKKDPRLRSSGQLLGFDFFGCRWPLTPRTAFYDWLYLKAMEGHKDYLKRLLVYKGFTDIEFNPKRSVNCQAKTCALFVSLLTLGILDEAMRSQNAFIATLSGDFLPEKPSPATS